MNFIRRHRYKEPDAAFLKSIESYIDSSKAKAEEAAERERRAAVEAEKRYWEELEAKRKRTDEAAQRPIEPEPAAEEQEIQYSRKQPAEDTILICSDKQRKTSKNQDNISSKYDIFQGIPTSGNTFSDYFVRLMREKNLINSFVYKRSDVSKQVFSNVISGKSMPSKNTVLSLAIGMKLNLRETENLLMKAGYAFSDVINGDLIVKYFIEHRKYDIFEINDVLYHYNLPLLGRSK